LPRRSACRACRCWGRRDRRHRRRVSTIATEVVPGRHEAASRESITTALGGWIPGSRTRPGMPPTKNS
jgi:hypothetical protein